MPDSPRLAVPNEFSHYRVIRRIGQGGVSWREAGNRDGRVTPGERMDLTDREFGLTVTRTLTYPNFSVSFRLFRLTYEMSLTHYVTFLGPATVQINQIVEDYDTENCQIVWR